MTRKAQRGLLQIGAFAAALIYAASDRAGAAPGTWIEAQELVAADAEAGDEFGVSVAVAGDVAMVGAHRDDHSGLVNAGSVYVFSRQSDGSWQEIQKLTAEDAATGDAFGAGLGFDGNTLLVGAGGDDHSGLVNAGAAYVFEKAGPSWRQVQKLTASDAAPSDAFGGSSCSVGGNVLVVPARSDDHSGKADAGSAYVFVRGDTGWHQSQKLIAADPQTLGRFGYATLTSGSAILVSASTKGTEYGSVYVFLLQGGGWIQSQKVFALDRGRYDEFGRTLAMDGATLVAGAPEDDHSGLHDPGSAYILEAVGGSLEHRQKIIAADARREAWAGAGVTIGGDYLAVGATFVRQPSLPGAVYLFGRQGSTWVQIQTLVPADGVGGDRFGRAPVLARGALFVGAWKHDHAGREDAGAVYLFYPVAGPNSPPVALCRDVVGLAGPECSAEVPIDDGCHDPDGDEIALTQEPPGPYALGDTDVVLTVSDGSLEDTCQATVTVVDEAAPFVSCNAPPSISRSEVPVSFTATGTDNCGLRRVLVRKPTCRWDWGNEHIQIHSQDPCNVVTQGDKITILNVGRNNEIRWLAVAIDQSGNRIVRRCDVEVVSGPVPVGRK